MSTLPDNVVVLADVRQAREAELAAAHEEWEAELISRPQLRVVRSDEAASPFNLEVFLRRAQIVLAEIGSDTEAHPIGA